MSVLVIKRFQCTDTFLSRKASIAALTRCRVTHATLLYRRGANLRVPLRADYSAIIPDATVISPITARGPVILPLLIIAESINNYDESTSMESFGIVRAACRPSWPGAGSATAIKPLLISSHIRDSSERESADTDAVMFKANVVSRSPIDNLSSEHRDVNDERPLKFSTSFRTPPNPLTAPATPAPGRPAETHGQGPRGDNRKNYPYDA